MTIAATSDNQILKYNIREIGLHTFATGSLPRSGLVQRQLWNIEWRRLAHSGLMLAARITLAHFSVSSIKSFLKSAGDNGIGTFPRPVMRSLPPQAE